LVNKSTLSEEYCSCKVVFLNDKLGDLVDVLIELMKTKVEKEIINVRVGEKYHESLINKDEIRTTYETNSDYIIFEDPTQEPYSNPNLSFKKTTLQEQYSSDKVDLLTKDEIKKLLVDEKLV